METTSTMTPADAPHPFTQAFSAGLERLMQVQKQAMDILSDTMINTIDTRVGLDKVYDVLDWNSVDTETLLQDCQQSVINIKSKESQMITKVNGSAFHTEQWVAAMTMLESKESDTTFRATQLESEAARLRLLAAKLDERGQTVDHREKELQESKAKFLKMEAADVRVTDDSKCCIGDVRQR